MALPSKQARKIAKTKQGHNLEAPPAFVEANKPYRWKPGVSANPAGRPPQLKTLAVILRNVLEEPASCIPSAAAIAAQHGLDAAHSSVGSVLAAAMVVQALNGDVDIIREILNRVDGKVVESVQLNLGPLATGLQSSELRERVSIILEREAATVADAVLKASK